MSGIVSEPASASPVPASPVPASSGRWKRRHSLAAAVLLLVLIIVVPPFISMNHFRRSIVHSISAGLGRPVEVSSIDLELFPRPGFVLHNFSVAEDPAFGAEPVMTAQTVTASLRASTLWHRRVEIATLRFDAPSVNLVRNAAGHWNFESLLHNSPALHAHSASAPAAAAAPMPFPYVEATQARVNFKLGPEKLPFSLEEANLALWRESRHKWRLRIRANPVRTDLPPRDAGQIRGHGTLITGVPLMDAPFRASLEWRQVQLDGIERLLRGDDNGWRGAVDWAAQAEGTLADFSVTSDIAVQSFHRAEFIPASEMDLSAHCQGRYARGNAALDALACVAPLDGGHLWLRGFSARLPRPTAPDKLPPHLIVPGHRRVQFVLDKVPAAFLLDLLGHVHPAVAPDASASGQIDGRVDCAWQGMRIPTQCTGALSAKKLRLELPALNRPLTFSAVRIESAPPSDVLFSSLSDWRLLPVRLALGVATEATLTGAINADGAAVRLTGPADLTELGRLAQSLRIPALSGEVESLGGDAELALTLQTGWLADSDWSRVPGLAAVSGGDAMPQPTPAALSAASPPPSRWAGTVRLRNADLKLAAIPVPLKLSSGQIDLTPGGVEWTALQGTFARIPFDGSVSWQTPCPASNAPCARSFALHFSRLDTGRLQAALRQGSGDAGLLDRINPFAAGAPALPAISGTVRADELSAGRLTIRNAVLRLRLKGRSARLLDISGDIFGGTVTGIAGEHSAGWARWGDGAPAYALSVVLRHLQPNQVGALWRHEWGGGAADVELNLKTQGWTAADLAQNARGKFALDWRRGTLPAATGPTVEFQRWQSKGAITADGLVLAAGRMFPRAAARGLRLPRTPQSVSGTVTFSRTLNLRLKPSNVSITGPLSAPKITPPSR